MNDFVDAPISFGGSGGLVWPPRPERDALAHPRRPSRDAFAPATLRLRPAGPAETFASCGRRGETWDACAARADAAASALAPLLEPRPWERLAARSSAATSASDDDEASDDTSPASSSNDAPPDHELDFQASAARSELLRGHPAADVPARILRRALRASRDAERDDRVAPASRVAGALAALPVGNRLLLAHTGGARAEETWITVLDRARGAAGFVVADSFRAPSRTSAANPALQIELAAVTAGGRRSPRDAQSSFALFASRDARGVSFAAIETPRPRVGRPRKAAGATGGAFGGASGTPPWRTSLLWSHAPTREVEAPASVALNPHGLPEALVASVGGGLRRISRLGAGETPLASVVVREAETRGGLSGAARRSWAGCAYGAHPRSALLATPREVTLEDLRAPPRTGGGAGSIGGTSRVVAARRAGDLPWRALAGPPPPGERGGGGLGLGLGLGLGFGARGGILEFGFATACDDTVELRDARRGSSAVLTWRHGLDTAPSWLEMSAAAGWRRRRPRGEGKRRPESDADDDARDASSDDENENENENESLGSLGMILAGTPAGGPPGGVLAFEFAGVREKNHRSRSLASEALDSDDIRALSAGARVPLGGGGGARGADASPAGFALTPPSSDAPGAAAWVTAEGALRVRAYEPAVEPATDRSGAARGKPTRATTRVPPALAFGVDASEASGNASGATPAVSNPPPKDGNRPSSLPLGFAVSSLAREDAAALGAAAGTSRVSAGSARDAALGAAAGAIEAAAALRGVSTSDAPLDESIEPRAIKIESVPTPMVHAFVARGEVPAHASGDGDPGRSADASAATRAADFFAAASRAASPGWALTPHELARVAAEARGDATAHELVDWRASLTRSGARDRNAKRAAATRGGAKTEDETKDDGTTRGGAEATVDEEEARSRPISAPATLAARSIHPPPASGAAEGVGARDAEDLDPRLAAFIGAVGGERENRGGGEEADRIPTRRAEYLAGVERWLSRSDGFAADAVVTVPGYTTMGDGDAVDENGKGGRLASSAAAATATLRARWEPAGGGGARGGEAAEETTSAPRARAKTPRTKAKGLGTKTPKTKAKPKRRREEGF